MNIFVRLSIIPIKGGVYNATAHYNQDNINWCTRSSHKDETLKLIKAMITKAYPKAKIIVEDFTF